MTEQGLAAAKALNSQPPVTTEPETPTTQEPMKSGSPEDPFSYLYTNAGVSYSNVQNGHETSNAVAITGRFSMLQFGRAQKDDGYYNGGPFYLDVQAGFGPSEDHTVATTGQLDLLFPLISSTRRIEAGQEHSKVNDTAAMRRGGFFGAFSGSTYVYDSATTGNIISSAIGASFGYVPDDMPAVFDIKVGGESAQNPGHI